MGAAASTPSIQPIFIINDRNGSEQQLRLNEQLDQYNAACIASAPNRSAAPTVEPSDSPADIYEKMKSIELEPWIRDKIRGTNISFFLDGLPHTREYATIWLPYHICENDRSFIKVMKHEAIHIHQRIYGSVWKEIYETVFNMKPWNGKLPAELDGKRRLNPDTILWPLYSWNNRVPVMVYIRPDVPRLTETRLVWYNIADNSWNLAAPKGWTDFFGTDAASICEHPNEMAAYFLTEAPTSPAMKDIADNLLATLRFKFS